MELDRSLFLARWGFQLLPRMLRASMHVSDRCGECGEEFQSGQRSVWILSDRVHEHCSPFAEPEGERAVA